MEAVQCARRGASRSQRRDDVWAQLHFDLATAYGLARVEFVRDTSIAVTPLSIYLGVLTAVSRSI
jgi:hypothetical protein